MNLWSGCEHKQDGIERPCHRLETFGLSGVSCRGLSLSCCRRSGCPKLGGKLCHANRIFPGGTAEKSAFAITISRPGGRPLRQISTAAFKISLICTTSSSSFITTSPHKQHFLDRHRRKPCLCLDVVHPTASYLTPLRTTFSCLRFRNVRPVLPDRPWVPKRQATQSLFQIITRNLRQATKHILPTMHER